MHRILARTQGTDKVAYHCLCNRICNIVTGLGDQQDGMLYFFRDPYNSRLQSGGVVIMERLKIDVSIGKLSPSGWSVPWP